MAQLALCFTMIFIFNFFVASTAQAAFPEKKISFSVMNEGVKETLQKLLEEEGVKFRFSSEVTNGRKIYIDVAEAEWTEIFQFIVQQNNLVYENDKNGILVFSYQSKLQD